MNHIPNNIHSPDKFIIDLMRNYIPNILNTKFTEFAYIMITTKKIYDSTETQTSPRTAQNGIGFIVTLNKGELPEKYRSGYHKIVYGGNISININDDESDDPSSLFTRLYVNITLKDFPYMTRYMKLKGVDLYAIKQYDLLKSEYQLHDMF